MRFLLPIIAHFLGAFIFQSSDLANKKRSSAKYFIFHCLIYSIFIIFSLIWFGSIICIIYSSLTIIISHAVIGYLRIKLTNILSVKKTDRKSFDFTLFIWDQILHIFIIIFSINMLKGVNIVGNTLLNWLLIHLTINQVYNGVILAFLYIICLSPTAIFIKKVFVLFSFQNDDENKLNNDIIKSGYLIGILERVIMLTLGLNGQLGAIGFVLAAKSLARFSQLNDKTFAEKYLVGTLLSVLISLFCIVLGNSLLKIN